MSQSPIKVTYPIEEILLQINSKLDKIDDRFDNLERKFDSKLDTIDQKFESKLDKIDQKFESKLDKIDQKFDQLNSKFESRLKEIDKRFESKFSELDKKFQSKFSELDKKIESKFSELDKKFESKFDMLQTEVKELKKDVGDFKRESLVSIESLKGNINALDVEVKAINKRLDSQEFINRSVAIGFIVALLTGVIKLFFPNLLNLPR
ncbi:MAG: hypothetical protein QNJ37_16975 [Crocosphaera sp.]|nr:hypothetical protein [Crocosphaera sp.]